MGQIVGASKITARYQVTIPEKVREHMKIEEGQTLVFVEEDGKIILKSEI
jgi:AbrB family looped-hinge helix DNA binding protein